MEWLENLPGEAFYLVLLGCFVALFVFRDYRGQRFRAVRDILLWAGIFIVALIVVIYANDFLGFY